MYLRKREGPVRTDFSDIGGEPTCDGQCSARIINRISGGVTARRGELAGERAYETFTQQLVRPLSNHQKFERAAEFEDIGLRTALACERSAK